MRCDGWANSTTECGGVPAEIWRNTCPSCGKVYILNECSMHVKDIHAKLSRTLLRCQKCQAHHPSKEFWQKVGSI